MLGATFRPSTILSERMSSHASFVDDTGHHIILMYILLTILSTDVRWEKS